MAGSNVEDYRLNETSIYDPTPSVDLSSVPSESTDLSPKDDGNSHQEIDANASILADVSVRGAVVGEGRMMEEKDHEDDGWKTVPAKGSDKRNKRNHSRNEKQGGTVSEASALSQTPARKGKQRTKATREKVRTRKLVKEIVGGILDDVDGEVEKRRKGAARAYAEERRKINEEKRRKTTDSSKGENVKSTSDSLERLVVDNQSSISNAGEGGERSRVSPRSRPFEAKSQRPGGRNGIQPNGKASADQKTAQTVPETVSGRSSGRTGAVETPTNIPDNESSMSLEDMTGVNKTSAEALPSQNSPPPLPKVLGTGHTISASSSVASSLEAPHATRHRHRGKSHELKEDDVGYHLVKLCEKLSDEMAVFMDRRAMALSIRRRERNALLAALQDSVTKTFGRCLVDIYGSCATQLDLPSSDLDCVVCGLDRPGPDKNHKESGKPSKKKKGKGKNNTNESKEEGKGRGQTQTQTLNGRSLPSNPNPQFQQAQQAPNSFQYFPPPSKNGARVLQLAVELEMQPWAVQVKAIPTATVPVIKLLADPSRVPGIVMDWMLQQQQHMANVPVSAEIPPPGASGPPQNSHVGHTGSSAPQAYYNGTPNQMPYHYPAALPWRGADIMNGLISIDVTFEGPEHGGIGSTIFSQQFVGEVCNESGVHPEATAAVQMITVIKELLAQKRLNEPYSGGLSSFAVLLLGIAVINERRLIKAEMDRIEKQRRDVAGSHSNDLGGMRNPSKASPLAQVPSRVSKDSTETRTWPLQLQIKQKEDITATNSEASQNDESVTSTTTPIAKTKPKPKLESQGKSSQPVKGKPPAANKSSTGATISFRDALKSAPKPKGTSVSSKQNSSAQPRSKTQAGPATATNTWAAIAKKKSPPLQLPVVSVASESDEPDDLQINSSQDVFHQEKEEPRKKVAADGIKSNGKVVSGKKLDKSSPAIATPLAKYSSTSGDEQKDGMTAELRLKTHGSDVTAAADSPSAESQGQLLFPQGTNDVLEVLCTGEPTAGKLLMHFLLFYGQLLEAQSTAIDVTGVHHPQFSKYPNRQAAGSHLSPFVPRKAAGSIDPVTGMFTVDPIVIYDPLEGAENNNVSRSCFAWASIRSVFAQCYMTLSGAVERGSGIAEDAAMRTGPSSQRRQSGSSESGDNSRQNKQKRWSQGASSEDPSQQGDSVLALLLSF